MSKTIWYYVSVNNYGKRTLILNPEYTREEIAAHMEKHRVDAEYIEKMRQNGIYADREISFVADQRMRIFYESWSEDDRPVGTSEHRFAKKDVVTFHPDGSFSWKYHWTIWDRLEEVADRFSRIFRKKIVTIA